MRKCRLIVGLFLVPLFVVNISYGKSIEELIEEMSEDLVENYTKPLVTGFGTAMNSGLYHTAAAHKTLGFDLGTRVMWVPIPDDAKTATYSVLTLTADPTTGDVDTTFTDVESSTIFGDEQGTTPVPPVNTYYIPETLPGGLDIPVIPLLVPQLNVGIFKGSELMIRFISVPFEETNISLLGLGLKQNFNALPFIPKLPVNIAAQFTYQSFKVGGIVTCNNTNFNLHVSKKLPIPIIGLTPYFGLGFENTKMDFTYNFVYPDPITGNPQSDKVELSFTGENGFRTVVGLKLKVFILNINADYNIGKYPSYSAGVGLSIR